MLFGSGHIFIHATLIYMYWTLNSAQNMVDLTSCFQNNFIHFQTQFPLCFALFVFFEPYAVYFFTMALALLIYLRTFEDRVKFVYDKNIHLATIVWDKSF